ncbi:MAG: multidrug ABC transporter ATP-binding protein [Candidatus Omnitrophica bacterium CG08_land_8_20_14_0_20_41_16]|uniref:Multidrug ABC transporter ATP-binding protein n=1 Tax=Candidatus Sherwoodlollariibacterium unditelluris TaxID=1974757 RepID=A0A2G9YJ88_9BACT|nr:MAG: multidrug ABC transporter ATP-binding protein [Candidatus Omnitrophica bacterium CG23_combo_of_CG06-09_8_20_14_all_41_10]PIS34303.1 MAG: multidrug ABC transporter ATP-binding protein [Candidatus Omnitrophica bacterium CG08_land_8_20_14_0_20_41_16]
MNPNNDIAVRVEKLEKKFGDFTAVDRISFEVKKGEIFGFLGPNGAGKSTTIRMLCGILTPTSGIGNVSGYDINRQQELIKQNIGYMSQKFSLYEDLTVEENIDFYSGIYKVPKKVRKAREDWIIKMAGIEAFRSHLTGTLSGGWKQRLALGCALIHEPKIIFLDEPTSGIDPIARNNFWKLIKEMAKQGVTVFVTTHYMDEAQNCDRLAFIYRGDIIAIGTPEGLKAECMKEDVLRISVPNPEEWIEKLEKLESVKEVALFGTVLHGIVKDGRQATPAITKLFAQEGIKDYSIEKIKASLEDVFVSLIEFYDEAGGFCGLRPS